MGLLDHRRTWNYEVSASAADCIRAFESAFNGRGGLITKAKWSVRTSNGSATAVYEGRRGLGAAGAIMSKTAAQEGETAIGSEVTFNIEESDGTKTRCSMWLASSGRSGVGGLLGATSDARFIRPYMQAVAREVRKLDPGARIYSS